MSDSDLIKRLTAERASLWKQNKDLLDAATARGDTHLKGADEQAYEQRNSRIDAIDERVTELRDKDRAGAETEQAFSDLLATPRTGRGRVPAAELELEAQFRRAILQRDPAPIDVHWSEPRSYFQPGVERREQRDLLTSAPANLMPVSFFSRLVEHLVETSAVLRAGATLVVTESGESLRVPRSTALSSAGIVAEAATIPESDPGLSQVTLGAYKYGFMVQVSTEMVEDVGFDLLGYLARESGVAIGNALGNHLINGTGTGQPRGVLLDATLGQSGPTGTTTSFGDQGTVGEGTDLLLDLHSSVIEPYVRSPAAAWLLQNGTLNTVRKLKTNTQGDPVGTDFVGPAPAGSQASAAMVGTPVFVDPFVPAMAASAKSVIFGDWSRYFVRMVNGVRFERSDDFAFDRDMVTFRALLRADGALIDNTGAVKYFQHSAT